MDKVVMFEVPVDDEKRASSFFKKVFGWEVESWNGSWGVTTVPEDRNWMPKEKGAINGEMYKRESEGDRPLVVVKVDSIARTLTKVKNAGGAIVREREALDGWGFYARVQDPEGNLFGLWEMEKQEKKKKATAAKKK